MEFGELEQVRLDTGGEDVDEIAIDGEDVEEDEDEDDDRSVA